MCMVFLMLLFYDVRDVYMLSNGLTFYDFYDSNAPFFLIMDNLGNILMLTFYWYLTSHYLKVACLFQLTFSEHTLSNLLKIQQ